MSSDNFTPGAGRTPSESSSCNQGDSTNNWNVLVGDVSSSTSSFATNQRTSATMNLTAGAAWLNFVRNLMAQDCINKYQTALLAANSANNYDALAEMRMLSHKSKNQPSANHYPIGFNLPDGTEIVKQTSSITGPKIPGTTNRGRKKTISLDTPSTISSGFSTANVSPAKLSSRVSDSADMKQKFVHNLAVKRHEVAVPAINPASDTILNSQISRSTRDRLKDLEMLGTKVELRPPLSQNQRGQNLSVYDTLNSLSINSGCTMLTKSVSLTPVARKSFNLNDHMTANATTSLDLPLNLTKKTSILDHVSSSSVTSNSSLLDLSLSSNSRTRKMSRPPSEKSAKRRCLSNSIQQHSSTSSDLQSTLADVMKLSSGELTIEIRPKPHQSSNNSSHQRTAVSANTSSVNTRSARNTPRYEVESDMGDTDGVSDSGSEQENAKSTKRGRRLVITDEKLLLEPLEQGWHRETLVKRISSVGPRGDVIYYAPCGKTFRHLPDIIRYLERNEITDLGRDNFTFTSKILIGNYYKVASDDGKIEPLPVDEITNRMEVLLAEKRKTGKRVANSHCDGRNEEQKKQMERESKQAKQFDERNTKKLLYERQRAIENCRQSEEIERQKKLMFALETERERRRQNVLLIKALDTRKRYEDKEKFKADLLREYRNKKRTPSLSADDNNNISITQQPTEDLEFIGISPLLSLSRIPSLYLSSTATANLFMIVEFLSTFGSVLGFDVRSLPSVNTFQLALLNHPQHENQLMSILSQLVICAIEDPGIPNPARHLTLLNQTLRQSDITLTSLSEIIRLYLYAVSTAEVKNLFGYMLNIRDQCFAKNADFYNALEANSTNLMSRWLLRKPFLALNPTEKTQIIVHICDDLLQNRSVLKQIDTSMDAVFSSRKEKCFLESRIKRLRLLRNKKQILSGLFPSNATSTPNVQQSTANTCSSNIVVSSASISCDLSDRVQTNTTFSTFKQSDNGQKKLEANVIASPIIACPLLDDVVDEAIENGSENEENISVDGSLTEDVNEHLMNIDDLQRHIEHLEDRRVRLCDEITNGLRSIRTGCLGEDRYFRKYWYFQNDKLPGIFVESVESNLSQSLTDMNIHINPSIDENVTLSPPKCSEDSNTANNTGHSEHNALDIVDNEGNSDALTDNHTKSGSNTEAETTMPDVFNTGCDMTPNIIQDNGHLISFLSASMHVFQSTDGGVVENNNCYKISGLGAVSSQDFVSATQAPDKCWFSLLPCEPCDYFSLTMPPDDDLDYMELTSGSQTLAELATQSDYKTDGTGLKQEPLSIESKYARGWWHLIDIEQFDNFVVCLNCLGMRECLLKTNLVSIRSSFLNQKPFICGMFEPVCTGSQVITMHVDTLDISEKSNEVNMTPEKSGLPEMAARNVQQTVAQQDSSTFPDMTTNDELSMSGDSTRECVWTPCLPAFICAAPVADTPGEYSSDVGLWVEMRLLEQIENIEERIAQASMQVKGWNLPTRLIGSKKEFVVSYAHEQTGTQEGVDSSGPQCPLTVARQRLLDLEKNVERRYLKPPLGSHRVSDINLATLGVEDISSVSTLSSHNPTRHLAVWREAVPRATNASQLSACLYALEMSIAWEKSIMKANCQFCTCGDNEEQLLLCDGCDKGYHTYCFRPPIDKIPDGDWYCFECVNKATGEQACVVCGKMHGRILVCDTCPRAYHIECTTPPLAKAPRGKWYCSVCVLKLPKAKLNCKSKKAKSSGSMTSLLPVHQEGNRQMAGSSQFESRIDSAQEGIPCTRNDRLNKLSQMSKELSLCSSILSDLETHKESWPFLHPVNTKQFPSYKKIIKSPMDLSSIRRKLSNCLLAKPGTIFVFTSKLDGRKRSLLPHLIKFWVPQFLPM